MLKLVDAAEGGMVHNATGKPMAKRVAFLKEGRMKEARAAGVLIGDTGHTLAGAVVHEAFKCCPPSTNASVTQVGDPCGRAPHGRHRCEGSKRLCVTTCWTF